MVTAAIHYTVSISVHSYIMSIHQNKQTPKKTETKTKIKQLNPS